METVNKETINIDKILHDKMGNKAKFVPRPLVSWLRESPGNSGENCGENRGKTSDSVCGEAGGKAGNPHGGKVGGEARHQAGDSGEISAQSL